MPTVGTGLRNFILGPRGQVAERHGRFSDHLAVADLLLLQGGCRFRIYSDSMLPTLRPGDLVELEPVEPGQLVAGDLLTIRLGPALVCHRLAAQYMAEDGVSWVETKSDRSSEPDPPVTANGIVGRVSKVIRPSGVGVTLWRLRHRARGLVLALRPHFANAR